MDEISLRTQFTFSDPAHKDKMIVDMMLQVELMRREILDLRFRLDILESRKGVSKELKEMGERSKRPKIIS